MKKILLKFIIILTIIATIVVLFYMHFFYYSLHMISPEFLKLENTSNTPYDFSITDTSIKMTSWDSQEAILTINILNSGFLGTSTYSDVSLTIVNTSTGQPVMIGVETDTTKWKKDEPITLSIPIQLSQIGFGQFDFYLRIWDDRRSQAITINNNLLFDKNGYYIGSLSVSHLLF